MSLKAQIEILLKGFTGLKAVIAIVFGIACIICATALFSVQSPAYEKIMVIFWVPTILIIQGWLLLQHDKKSNKTIRKVKKRKVVITD